MNNRPISLVTGANRGIGKEVVRQLAERGHTVLLTARDLDKARQAAHDLGFDSVIPAQLNVTDEQSINALRDYVQSEFGRLDVLVNNAAIHYDTWQKAINADFVTVQEAVETNLFHVEVAALGMGGQELADHLAGEGILVFAGEPRMRLATHRMVTSDDIDEVLRVFSRLR